MRTCRTTSNGRPGVQVPADRATWISNFSHAHTIGVALLDSDLHYQSVNDALAALNGASPTDHIGRTVQDVLGSVAGPVQALIRSVQATGKTVSTCVTGTLPGSTHCSHWLATYFPVRSATPGAVGGLVVDVTELRRVETVIADMIRTRSAPSPEETLVFAREMQRSLHEYSAALEESMHALVRRMWRLDRCIDPELKPIVQSLDLRVASVQTLLAPLATASPGRPQHLFPSRPENV